MNDDLDVEALLEAPFQKNSDGNQSKNSTPQSPQLLRRVSRSPSPRRESRDRYKDSESRSRRHREDSRSRYRDRSKERYRDRGSERSKRHRSRSRSSDRYSSRRHRSRDNYRRSERSRSRSPRRRPPRSPSPEVNEYDRDLRTVFVQQLAARLKQRELHNFFAKVGKVREAKIVSDRNTGRSKGVGYIEFYDRNSVPGAIALTGQKLLGIPVIVEHTESEKNRIGMTSEQYVREQVGNDIPYHRLYVGSVHFNLSEEDLKRVFEPFGPIEFVNLHKDPETGRSRGFGFVQFKHGDDAKKALEQMNGQQLNGRPIRVGLVTQKSSLPHISLDDTDNPGFALTSQSRTELMQKLARQEDESVYLNSKSRSPTKSSNAVLASSRSIILKNMFNPDEETSPNWVRELEEDVVDECRAYGTVVHIQVEKNSSGDIYLKFSDVSSAEKAVKALNGRWFGGRQVIADYIPEKLYDVQFPKAASV